MDGSIIKPISHALVFVNGRRKTNPRTGEVLEDVVCSRPIFKALDVEEIRREKRKRPLPEGGSSDGRALARARKHLFELAACNSFDYFITLTLDAKEIDRYDYKIVITRLSVWLSNLVQRHGFRYVLVPELHKDGAIHFHGLVAGGGLKLVDSGKAAKGKPIYNIVNWRYGFTTAVELSGDYDAVCKYITKYISKSNQAGTIAGRYFYHGGELAEASVAYYDCPNWREVGGKEVVIEDAGLTMVYR